MRALLVLLLGLLIGPAVAQPAPTPATAALVCAYNSSPPTGTSGTFIYVQCDSQGHILYNPIAATRTITATAQLPPTLNDYFLCINKTIAGATSVALPASPPTGKVFIVKDCKGDAATNNITITPAAGNIDSAGSFVINGAFGVWRGIYNGAAWSTI